MTIKKLLAETIVEELYGPKPSEEAEEYFEKTIQRQELPDDIPIYQHTGSKVINIIELLAKTKLVTSRAEAKRLVEQGGVEIDNQRVTNQNEQIEVNNEMIIKVGKRRFAKIRN